MVYQIWTVKSEYLSDPRYPAPYVVQIQDRIVIGAVGPLHPEDCEAFDPSKWKIETGNLARWLDVNRNVFDTSYLHPQHAK